MGVYRATMNIPGVKAGATITMADDDPRITRYAAMKALVRIDGEAPRPARLEPVVVESVKAETAGDSDPVDGEIEAIDDDAPGEDEDSKEEAPGAEDSKEEAPEAEAVEGMTAAQKRAAQKKAALAEAAKTRAANKAAGGVSTVNPDIGIGFD